MVCRAVDFSVQRAFSALSSIPATFCIVAFCYRYYTFINPYAAQGRSLKSNIKIVLFYLTEQGSIQNVCTPGGGWEGLEAYVRGESVESTESVQGRGQNPRFSSVLYESFLIELRN